MDYPLKNISYWAAANASTARWLIFLLSLFSGVLFFEIGLFLSEFTLFPASFIWLFAVAIAACCFFSYKYGNRRLKRAIIYLSLSVLWLHLGNQSVQILSVSDAKNIETASIAPVKPIAKAENKIKKSIGKYLSKQKKQLRNSLSLDNFSPVAAFFIFFLLALLALFIAFFLSILSCSLGCSGQVVLSYVVLMNAAIFALGGLFLIGYAIYRAVKKPKNNLSYY